MYLNIPFFKGASIYTYIAESHIGEEGGTWCDGTPINLVYCDSEIEMTVCSTRLHWMWTPASNASTMAYPSRVKPLGASAGLHIILHP